MDVRTGDCLAGIILWPRQLTGLVTKRWPSGVPCPAACCLFFGLSNVDESRQPSIEDFFFFFFWRALSFRFTRHDHDGHSIRDAGRTKFDDSSTMVESIVVLFFLFFFFFFLNTPIDGTRLSRSFGCDARRRSKFDDSLTIVAFGGIGGRSFFQH